MSSEEISQGVPLADNILDYWRQAKAKLMLCHISVTWRVGVLAIVIATILASIRILLSGHQYQINDLDPVGSSATMIRMCLWPYQHAGLGLPNPIPVPSLCLLGGAAAILGPTGAQHFFLIGCLGGAGLSMFRLLRRYQYAITLCVVGGLLYEFSPAIVNQFQFGGPGILLSGAVIPAILAETIVTPGESLLRPAARAGALLGLASLFNPQAPFLLAVLLIPFLGAVAFRNGWWPMIRFTAMFMAIALVCSIPVVALAHGEASVAASAASSLAKQLITSVRATSGSQFAVPYLYVGLLPAAVGACVIVARHGHAPSERAVVVATTIVIYVWIILRLMPMQLLHLWIGFALFKDFIKLQILFGIPVTVLTIVAIQFTASRLVVPRPARLAACLVGITLVAGPSLVVQGGAAISGDVGIASYRVPSQYQSALTAIHRRDPVSQAYRDLWLPQDFPVFGTLSTLDPSSLVYRPGSSPLVRGTVIRTFDAFVRDDPADVAPLLAQVGVRFVVVATTLRVQADAPFEAARPNIAAIAGTKLLAGAPRYFINILDRAQGLVRVSQGDGYKIYENKLWYPIVSHYRGLLVMKHSNTNSGVSLGPPLALHWAPAGGAKASETPSGVTIMASHAVSWSPVTGDISVKPGVEYEVSGDLKAWNAAATHVKIEWLGPSSVTMSMVAVLPTASSEEAFNRQFAAPSGVTRARVFLMGGWSTGSGGFSHFAHIRVRPILPKVISLGGVSAPQTEWLLQRQLSTLLIEGGSSPAAVRGIMPMNDVITLQGSPCARSEQGCAMFMNYEDVRRNGSWGFATDAAGVPLFSWFTAEGVEGSLTIPARTVDHAEPGSVLSWLAYPTGKITLTTAMVHSVVVRPGDGPITIRSGGVGGVIGNLMMLPPQPRNGALTRVLDAYSPRLREEPSNREPLAIRDDWASVYRGEFISAPSAAGNGLVQYRIVMIGLSMLFIVVSLVGSVMCFRPRRRIG